MPLDLVSDYEDVAGEPPEQARKRFAADTKVIEPAAPRKFAASKVKPETKG